MGGNFHLKLNISSKPIANKYHEGKMKRTLKRELKVPEIAEREANGTSLAREIAARRGDVSLPQRKRGSVLRLVVVDVSLSLRHLQWHSEDNSGEMDAQLRGANLSWRTRGGIGPDDQMVPFDPS